jgi:hypothetical protein
MFDRLPASFALAQSSWHVLRLDKRLIIFPIISGAGCLLVIASFALPFLSHPQWLDFLEDKGNGIEVPWWVYTVAFAFYYCNYFVVIFCNSALISCALLRFNGETPTLADGFQAAFSRLPQILAWALVSATVGVILKAIESAHEKAGQFISALLGTAWSVITFFVVPVLVVEKVGPFQAIQRSLAILRGTWGEALVGRLGLGLLLFLLMLPGCALVLGGSVLLGQHAGLFPGLGLVTLGGIYLLLWSAVGSALNGIFLAALYQYAALGSVADGFDRSTMQQAFRRQ